MAKKVPQLFPGSSKSFLKVKLSFSVFSISFLINVLLIKISYSAAWSHSHQSFVFVRNSFIHIVLHFHITVTEVKDIRLLQGK